MRANMIAIFATLFLFTTAQAGPPHSTAIDRTVNNGVLGAEYFLVAAPTDDGGLVMEKIVQQYNAKRVVLVADRRPKWRSFLSGAEYYLNSVNAIILKTTIDNGQKDFTSFKNAIDQEPDLFICMCFDDDALSLVTSLRKMGYAGPLVGTDMTPIGNDIKPFVKQYAPKQITGGIASFDSVGNGDNPFEGGDWGNAKGGSAWAEYNFSKPTDVKSVYIGMAGTDVTAAGSTITLSVRDAAGWRPVWQLKNKVINRDFSGGENRGKLPPQTINISQTVTGVRLDMTGHGWFAASDIRVIGQ